MDYLNLKEIEAHVEETQNPVGLLLKNKGFWKAAAARKGVTVQAKFLSRKVGYYSLTGQEAEALLKVNMMASTGSPVGISMVLLKSNKAYYLEPLRKLGTVKGTKALNIIKCRSLVKVAAALKKALSNTSNFS